MTALFAGISSSVPFDTAGKLIQDYVVVQLVTAIKAQDKIVLVRSKIPSGWESPKAASVEEISFSDANLLGLALGSIAPVEFLKASISARINGCALFYPPIRGGKAVMRNGERVIDFTNTGLPIPYHPAMHLDKKMCRLAFVRPQREPLKDRIRDANPHISFDFEKEEKFVSDARALPSSEFLAKYNLTQAFVTSVYSVTQGCMFLVDHPDVATADEKTKETIYNIYLSHQEVSEIVYLAYVHEDGEGGTAKYAEAARQSQVLQPMPEAAFKTLIGQKLHAALSDPEYGMAEKRAWEEVWGQEIGNK